MPRIQSFHPPSTMPASKSGPANRIATSSRVFPMSTRETGHQPRSFRVSAGEASPHWTMTYMAMSALRGHERVTVRILARIEEGASRDS